MENTRNTDSKGEKTVKPNEVNEILRSIIQELALPVDVGDGRTLLIVESAKPTEKQLNQLMEEHKLTAKQLKQLVEGPEQTAKQYKETILKHWQGEAALDAYLNKNRIDGNWRMTHRSTLSEIHNKVEKLAIATYRVVEVKEVLQSLITERKLPFEVYYEKIYIAILPDNPSNYQTDDMVELETVIQEMQQDSIPEGNDLTVYVRHGGFVLYQEEDYIDVDFSLVQQAAQRLQSEIEKHGLQVRLLHQGFALVKDRGIEAHISEAEELAFRLTVMTGINYRVLSYSMGLIEGRKPGWTHEINWQEASLLNDRAYPYI